MADVKQPISSQPEGTVQMKAGGSRNAKNLPVGPDGKRDWSFGLLDCFGGGSTCFWSIWCPCIVYSKNRQRLRHLQQQGAPLPGGGERYDDHCCIYCGLCVLTAGNGWLLHVPAREGIREHYGIRGDAYSDCLTAWLCRPCSLTQERREIELEEGSL